MTTYNNSAANIQYLSAKTGLAPSVAAAWLANEGQSVANPTNPLNIVKGGTPNQTGTSGGFGTYASPTAGLDAAAWLLSANSAYRGILNAIQSGTPIQQAQAIQNSPWAAGHYGYSGISSMISPTGTTAPGGGATTPLSVSPTTTNPGTSGGGTWTPSSSVSALGISTDPSHIFTTAEVWKIAMTANGKDPNAPFNANDPTYQKYSALPGKTVGQLTAAINSTNDPLTGVLNTALSGLGFLPGIGSVTTAATGTTAFGGTSTGIKIPDVQTAITFLAIILVGIAFIGVGGLIALRKK